jgi:hypothetical protein
MGSEGAKASGMDDAPVPLKDAIDGVTPVVSPKKCDLDYQNSILTLAG